jgi:hypothetical protein
MLGARGSVVSWGTMLQAGRSQFPVPMRLLDFFNLPQAHCGRSVDSDSNRNQYQKSSWGLKGRPARKADNLTAICEPIV